jgi:hypothetical protein
MISSEQVITNIKQKGMEWINTHILVCRHTTTKPGSISHLLYGEQPSEQSVNIKMGKFGEFIAKEMVLANPQLELLPCGVQKINNRRKDVDLIFIDKLAKKIYYKELKGNIELDTEKLPATIEKCDEIKAYLKETYPEYTIDCGILNWSVYDRKILTSGISNIRTFENAGVAIEHMSTFLDIVGLDWSEHDFYDYFREIGKRTKSFNNS